MGVHATYVKSNMGLKDELVVVSDPNDEPEEEEEEEEEEDLVDPKDAIEEGCHRGCEKYTAELQSCEDRVNSRSSTEETCEQELMDLMHCVDACVARGLFAHLK